MRLTDLIDALAQAPISVDSVSDAGLDVEISRVEYDSRRGVPGTLFCCVRGEYDDGHDFAHDAVANGASAIMVDHQLDVRAPQLLVDDTRVAMAWAAAAVEANPSIDIAVVGVTGTNGKTTTTLLLDAIVKSAGQQSAVLGTLSGARTTPEAPDLQSWLASQRAAGADVVAIEVSSHALALHRVDATRFAMAVFTNLGRDHLDFHESMDKYFEAKERLFTPVFSNAAAVNTDDAFGRRLFSSQTVPTVGYSINDASDLVVGATMCSFRWRESLVELQLGGRFNVLNALAAAEAATGLGFEPSVIAAGLSGPIVIPGRFEIIDAGQPFRVVVDYAHTPDALAEVLSAAREIAGERGRVHVVFGCGGDRDTAKRSMMGETAARLADQVVLTADNSRSEDTESILHAVRAGVDAAENRLVSAVATEPDRSNAIAVALRNAEPDDVVVIAGKGHETTQIVGDTVTPFDDRVVAREHLRTMIGGAK